MDKRPIAEAPRDGTWVLLYGGRTTEDFEAGDDNQVDRERPVVGKWLPGYDGADWLLDDDDPLYGVERDTWLVSYWDSDWRSRYIAPTHWSPLQR